MCVFVCVSVSRTKHSQPSRLEALDTLLTRYCSSQLAAERKREEHWVWGRERKSRERGTAGRAVQWKRETIAEEWEKKGGRVSWEREEVVWCGGEGEGKRWGGSGISDNAEVKLDAGVREMEGLWETAENTDGCSVGPQFTKKAVFGFVPNRTFSSFLTHLQRTNL